MWKERAVSRLFESLPAYPTLTIPYPNLPLETPLPTLGNTPTYL